MSIEQPGSFPAEWVNAPSIDENGAAIPIDQNLSDVADIAREISDSLSDLRKGESLLILPGKEFEITSKAHRFDRALLVSKNCLILRNGIRSYYCAFPNIPAHKWRKRPLVCKLAAVILHKRPYGPHRPERFVYALDAGDVVIGRLDDSDTWEMRLDQLEALCSAIGIGFERRVFEGEREVLRSAPNLAEPKLEFAVEHYGQEVTRQWAQGIWLVMVLALLFTSAGMWLVLASPLGPWYRDIAASAAFVCGALTFWSRSATRMQRSLRRARSQREHR